MTLRPALVALALAGAAAHAQYRPAQPSSPLDAERVLPAEHQLSSGHLAEVPVQKFYRRQSKLDGSTLWGTDGTNRVALDTWGCPTDTAILVRMRLPSGAHDRTFFNDDGGAGYGKASLLDTGTFTGPRQLDIFVFSNERGTTANCTLWVNTGDQWGVLASLNQMGGTLVDVGPMRQGAFIEVKTRSNGMGAVRVDADTFVTAYNDATELVLFDLANQTVAPGITNVTTLPPVIASGSDPKAIVLDGTRASVKNFVLVGKTLRHALTNDGVELRVDLVRGPLNDGYRSASFPSSGGAGTAIWLEPGRYHFWVDAWTSEPVGQGSGTRVSYSPAVYAPLEPYWVALGYKNPEPLPAERPSWFRGTLNQNAFELTASERIASWGPTGLRYSWRPKKTRVVPLGAFGSFGRWNRFVLEVEVTTAEYHSLSANRLFSAIAFQSAWYAQANPDATELKTATANMLYTSEPVGSDEVNPGNTNRWGKYKNASNLLAARGSVDRAALRVDQPLDQGPFQFDADIVTLNEVSGDAPLDDFRAEANARGTQPWGLIEGVQESSVVNSSRGALLINAHHQATGPTGMSFSGWVAPASLPYLHVPGCATVSADNLSCPIGDGNYTWTSNAAFIPAQAVVARAQSLDGAAATGLNKDRPIAVINFHLSDYSYGVRDVQLTALIEKVRGLLAYKPEAFNRFGNPDPLGNSNRILIQGDSNMQTHSAGEHYWVLKRLRDAFGYAVDVSLAVDGSVRNSYGMHNYGAEVMDTSSLVYVPNSPQAFNRPAFRGPVSGALLPVRLGGEWWNTTAGYKYFTPQMATAWPMESPENNSYPWWSSTWRAKRTDMAGYTNRYDVFFLVGRGWEFDDPVVDYAVMQDNDHPNPFSVIDAATGAAVGVEMWHSKGPACYDAAGVSQPGGTPTTCLFGYNWLGTVAADANPEGALSNSPLLPNYRPNHDAGDGIGRGRAALQTDHKPIGARLRVISNGLNDGWEDR